MPSGDFFKDTFGKYVPLGTRQKKVMDVEHEPNINLADIFENADDNQPMATSSGNHHITLPPGIQDVNYPWDGYINHSRQDIIVQETMKVSYSDPANPTSYSECTLKEYVEMKVMAALREIVEGK